jgi:hypothetical protein
MAPDGFSRLMMVVNGQYPGPTVYASELGKSTVLCVRLTNSRLGRHYFGYSKEQSAEQRVSV